MIRAIQEDDEFRAFLIAHENQPSFQSFLTSARGRYAQEIQKDPFFELRVVYNMWHNCKARNAHVSDQMMKFNGENRSGILDQACHVKEFI